MYQPKLKTDKVIYNETIFGPTKEEDLADSLLVNKTEHDISKNGPLRKADHTVFQQSNNN